MIATNNGSLDVVCGFSVIDDDCRMVVLEGLAGPGNGMQSIYYGIGLHDPIQYPKLILVIN